MEESKIKEYIKEAEYVLIGCGRELSNDKTKDLEMDMFKPLEKWNIYNQEELLNYVGNKKYADWLNDILEKHYNKIISKEKNIYQTLFSIIKEKNYFIITTNTDEKIYQSDLEISRIVSPCGNDGLFQCSDNCTQEVWKNDEYIEYVLSNLEIVLKAIKEEKIELLNNYFPRCKNCQKEAIYNIRIDKLQYNENGYLTQWKKYMDWMQRTLNRKIVMLELGEDFSNPTVIRWPFEKTAFLNNKAVLFRVNEVFPQISEEIKEKAYSIKLNSTNFLEILGKE